MKRLYCLSIALLFLPGCWTGGLAKKDQIAYQHESVRWVYKAGGQLAVLWGIILVPQGNRILDVQPGEGCVLVTEGDESGCSAAPQARLRGTHALNLATGHPTIALGSTHRYEPLRTVWQEDRKTWKTHIDKDLSAHGSLETNTFFLHLPSDILILEVPQGNSLGWVISAFRMPEDVLILGLSYGYVVCVDMKKLPTIPKLRDGIERQIP